MADRRQTALFGEHLALGADMEGYAWGGMAMPWTYRTTLAEEQRAVRERAGLADVSQLNVVRVVGPDAVACIEELSPRPIATMPTGSTRFSVVLSRFGRISDEALIMRVDADDFWLSHGCGNAQTQLNRLSHGREVKVQPLEDMHVLSLQGPRARDVLAAVAEHPVDGIAYLQHRRVSLAGKSVLLSRSGFTGEPGFEIFCARADAVPLWRALTTAGRSVELIPYGYRCVDLLRIEAGLPLHPADLALCGSLWEAGLGWVLKGKKGDFVGRAAVAEGKGKREYRIAGARSAGDVALSPRTKVLADGEVVGMVTSSAYCPAHDETLAMLRIRRDAFAGDAPVLCRNGGEVAARLAELPFRPRRTEFD